MERAFWLMEQKNIYSSNLDIVSQCLVGAKIHGVKFKKILNKGTCGIVLSCKMLDEEEFLKGAFITNLEEGWSIVVKI